MPTNVAITRIDLRPPSTHGSEKGEAVVTVEISRESREPMQMVFRVEGYSSLDRVAEEVRGRVLQFAEELQAAAQNPLVQTQPVP